MYSIVIYTNRFSQLHRSIPLLQRNQMSVTFFEKFSEVDAFLSHHVIEVFLSDKTDDLDDLISLLDLLKERGQTHTFVMSANLQNQQRMQLWEAGLDLLLTYIPSWSELQYLLRKHAQHMSEHEGLLLDTGTTYYASQGSLKLPDRLIRFRPKENKIFACLTQHRSRIVHRQEIMQYVWPDPETSPNPDTLDVYIRRLRLKLRDWGKNIKTYRGFGYRFELGV